jgi:predicted nucleic acid-binding protein
MDKKMILCDTNILINWFKEDKSTIEALEKIGLRNVLLPSVAVMEILQGAINSKELLKLMKKLNNYNILHFNEKISRLSIQLIEKYNLSHNLIIPDAIIAAMALVYDLELFTQNIKDFKYIPNLKLYK